MEVTFKEKFPAETATWVNNDQIFPYSRVKLLNHILKLDIILEIRFFALELSRDKIHTIENHRKIGKDINGDCPF